MRNLIFVLLLICTSCLSQIDENDSSLHLNSYKFSDSVQFYWPNKNLQYKFGNIFEERFVGSIIYTYELFYSKKTGKPIHAKKFIRKYGINTVIELRDKAQRYLKYRNEEIKAEKSILLKKEYQQDSLSNFSVLDILKNQCIELSSNDTIRIKHGLFLGLGEAYMHTIITKVNEDFCIQNFIEETNLKPISEKKSIPVRNFIHDSECRISVDKMFYLIYLEKEKCWQVDHTIDHRWTFYFDDLLNEKVGIKDFFGYSLYSFFNEIVCE